MNKKLYTISFVEGASVMAAEICGAKLLAPFFGSSLYVWSAVMAITLGGLASGYFIGGQLSKHHKKEKILLTVLLLAVCCICVMPFLKPLFIFLASRFSLVPSVIVSVLFLLFPTTLCMGATSPLIISILTTHAENSGENSGKIYAISTVGGILATFLCGFYLIPNFGVKWSLLCFASLLFLVSFLLIIKKNAKSHYFLIFLSFAMIAYSFKPEAKNRFAIYSSEGILGKLEIRDEPDYYNFDIPVRKLLINTTIQTEMNLNTCESMSQYVKLIEKNTLYFPKGKALLMGLGGGVLANVLHKNNYNVTAVEFDERIINASKKYFFLNDSIKTICADARYFINNCNEKFNVLIFDIFKSEEQPAHVITEESLYKLKSILDTNAVIIVNSEGHLNDDFKNGNQCLLATFKKCGYNLKLCSFSEDESARNLLIIASLKSIKETLHGEIYPIIYSDLETINTDDKLVLEKLNANSNERFRSLYLRNYILKNF